MNIHLQLRKYIHIVVIIALMITAAASCAPKSDTGFTLPPISERTPPPVKAAGWNGVVVKHLALDFQTSGNCGGVFTRNTLLNSYVAPIESYLQSLGVELVDSEEGSDAVFVVQVNCEALSETYAPESGPLNPAPELMKTTCFAGFNISGRVYFSAPGYDKISANIERQNPLPEKISESECEKEPEDVFNMMNYDGNLAMDQIRQDIAELCGSFWGGNTFAWYLYDGWVTRVIRMTAGDEELAIRLLSSMESKGMDAIPTLIAILKQMPKNEKVVNLLKSISGQDFGGNPRQWEKWWNKQQ